VIQDKGKAPDPKDQGTAPAKPGPLSKDARADCAAFGKRVAEETAALAKKYHKSKAAIRMAAGLKLQGTRDTNLYCKYRQWYAREHPKSQRGDTGDTDISHPNDYSRVADFHAFSAEMDVAFREFKEELDQLPEKQRDARWAKILEDLEETDDEDDITPETCASILNQNSCQIMTKIWILTTYLSLAQIATRNHNYPNVVSVRQKVQQEIQNIFASILLIIKMVYSDDR
jgi:uncharacterized protein YdcH (DUF465 family)